MIIVWGSVIARSGQVDALLELSLDHVRRSRREDGCLDHGAYVDAENRDRVVFFEKWVDEPALRTHFKVRESIEFVAGVSALADGAPTIEIYEANQLSLR